MKNRSYLLFAWLLLAAGTFLLGQKPGTDSSRPSHSSVASAPSSTGIHSLASKSFGDSGSSAGGAQTRPGELPHVPKAPKVPKPSKFGKQKIEKSVSKAHDERLNGTQAAASPTPTMKIVSLLWGAPIPIKQGQSLSIAVMQATADAPGTITYTPSLGFEPPRGVCIVTARFTPSDSKQYSSATATVTVTVE
jgi:hypothetical protein